MPTETKALKGRRALKSKVLAVVSVCLVLVALPALSQDEDSFQADIRGQKTWTIRYGIGDPRGLALAGVAPYQLILEQSLAVDIRAEALSVLTIDAHFNDQEPESMQSLTMYLDAGDLKGVFGDFSVSGKEAFAVYNKALIGVRLDYWIGEAQLTGILSQIEGISESRTFVGRTANEEVLFSSSPPGAPWLDQTYLLHIDGLHYYELDAPFVEGFSEVALSFETSGGLQALLDVYGLTYLSGVISESPSEGLSLAKFTVVSNAEDVLLLTQQSEDLLRERLRDAITTYNQQEGLTGSDKERYPFNEGTDYERAFLDQLAAFVFIVVDEGSYPLIEGGRRRYYDLGRTDVEEDSVVVEVSLDGGTFRPITDPDLSDYRASTFSAEGIIELDFPASFFVGEENTVRVSFDYAISGDMFMLGLSIVSGSEKVYLNGTLLERDIDYSIDYEIGALILFAEVGEEDTIRIDYERSRSGLGSSAEYARGFYGATLALPLSEVLTLELSLLQAEDSAIPVVAPDQARTMPNTHTVSGVTGSLRLDDFSADFTLGYNHNQFPLDDNMRTNLPNEATAILCLPEHTIVGHSNGVSVYSEGAWTGYDTSDGLTGNRVYDITSDGTQVFFATGSGITVLSLEGEAPLAQVGNWRRYYLEDGLPNAAVHSVTLVDGTLWVGTEGGLASVRVEEVDESSSWKRYIDEPFIEMGTVLCLASDGEVLYVGSERGLFALEQSSGVVTELSGTGGLRVYDLLLADRTLYVASESGLRSFRDGVGMGWLLFGEEVYCLALREGELWYGTETGLHRAGAESVLTDWDITAIASTTQGSLWAGSRADTEYQVSVWEIEDAIELFDNTKTEIDGRDRTRFTDIPLDEHTDRGLLTRVNFRRDMGKLTLSGSFESVLPAFMSIGRLDRRDATGWNLAGSVQPAEGLYLTATHSFYLMDQASEQSRSTMENLVTFAWDFGPHLDASLRQRLVNEDALHRGFDDGSLYYSFALRNHLFDDAVYLSLRWNEAFNANYVVGTYTRDNTLGLEGTYRITPELSMLASWSRPMTIAQDEKVGSEQRTWAASWAPRFDMVDIAAGYSISASRSIADEVFRTTQSAELDLRFEGLAVWGWQVTPSLELRFENDAGIITLNGRGTVRSRLDMISTRVSLGREVSGLGQLQQQHRDWISASLDYLGVPDLRPTLTYTANSRAAIYQGVASPTFDHTLTGRLSWSPINGPQDRLSISIHQVIQQDENTITATLQNTFTHSISDAISSRLELDGSYEPVVGDPDLDLTLKGYLDVVLAESWQAFLAGSYLAGTKSGGGFYHSLLFELSVATTF